MLLDILQNYIIIRTRKNYAKVRKNEDNTKEKLVEFVDSGTDIEFNVKIGKDETGGLDKCTIVTAKYIHVARSM